MSQINALFVIILIYAVRVQLHYTDNAVVKIYASYLKQKSKIGENKEGNCD